MKISILCSDPRHPVNAWLERWSSRQDGDHEVRLVRRSEELTGGDFLFLVSCTQIISKTTRGLYRHSLVLHASALPAGKGMSPHIWQILEGKNAFVVTLLNAEDKLDAGDIWQQREIQLEGHELYEEINTKLFDIELELMSWAIEHCDRNAPRKQVGKSTSYRRRTPDDSRIDPAQSIESQFNLLRVSDPARYPAFFDLRGHRYKIVIEKI